MARAFQFDGGPVVEQLNRILQMELAAIIYYNRVVGPLSGLCALRSGASGQGAPGNSAVSATRLGDVSRRRRGGPPHRSIDEGSIFRVEHRVAGAMAPDRRDRPQCLRR
jgi:hypothetical protein